MIEVMVDGASRFNNISDKANVSAIGMIFWRDGRLKKKSAKMVGDLTNNETEYSAIIEALKYLKKIGLNEEEIVIKSDSLLCVNQINGTYDCNAENLKPFLQSATDRLKDFPNTTVVHIRREHNKADDIVNEYLEKEGYRRYESHCEAS